MLRLRRTASHGGMVLRRWLRGAAFKDWPSAHSTVLPQKRGGIERLGEKVRWLADQVGIRKMNESEPMLGIDLARPQ
ncbi:MAG: hypothetical protein AAGC64_11360 [Bacteroidota bacterium]